MKSTQVHYSLVWSLHKDQQSSTFYYSHSNHVIFKWLFFIAPFLHLHTFVTQTSGWWSTLRMIHDKEWYTTIIHADPYHTLFSKFIKYPFSLVIAIISVYNSSHCQSMYITAKTSFMACLSNPKMTTDSMNFFTMQA